MTNPTIPSRNPAVDGVMGGVMGTVFKKQMQRVDGQLPAVVISYNRATNIAKVQPLISLLTTGGGKRSRAPIASVPVLALGGGGFCINFPLKKGDIGWIEASDRDISLYMQAKYNEAIPNTQRMHSFEDGRFIPDAFAQYAIAGADTASMIISSYDGSVRISLGPGKITLAAATVEIDTQNYNVNTVNANLNASGNVTITGASNRINGPVNMPDGATIGGIVFGSHVHSNVQNGPNNSGGPH